MASEFDVGHGWFLIIDALSAVLSRLEPPLRAVQVKQKFGTLRYHVSPKLRRGAPSAITVAEMFSGRICEVTGYPGDLMFTQGGAVRTLSMQPAAWLAAGAPLPNDYSLYPPDADDFPMPAPPVSIRMAWTDFEAAEALRQRHGPRRAVRSGGLCHPNHRPAGRVERARSNGSKSAISQHHMECERRIDLLNPRDVNCHGCTERNRSQVSIWPRRNLD